MPEQPDRRQPFADERAERGVGQRLAEIGDDLEVSAHRKSA